MVLLVVGTNTYVTRAQANAQLSETFVYATVWAALDGASRDRALVEAFHVLERQRYKGVRTGGGAQSAQFPRDGIANCDGYDQSGVTPAPIEVLQAQVLLAAAIVVDPSLATADSTASNIRRAAAGSAEVEYFRAGSASGGPGTRFPTPIQELLRCYLLGPGTGFASVLANGTGADQECPEFGLGWGF
jgi:hypothetical protein